MSIIACSAFVDNYIWLIINESKQTLMCVDPGDAEPVLFYAKKNGLTLTDILITHHHHDHTGGVDKLLKTFTNATVYGPDDTRISPHTAVKGTSFPIDNYNFQVLYTPGHTLSHLCYYEPNQGWLFCGDTLFSAGCGRLFEGTMEELYQSLLVLRNLPDATKVYCGHEYTRQNLRFAATIEPDNPAILRHAKYLSEHPDLCSLPSTIQLEKQINPFMRIDSLPVKTFAQLHGVNPDDAVAVFRLLREMKDSFK